MATEVMHRSRSAVLLAFNQVRYQLLLLLRSPLGFFLSIVFPLLLLICLNVITPGKPEDGLPYAQWLTPAMSAFCLLNACYVTAITSLVLAREEGILKRLRGTPLPAWAYLAGRSGSAFVTSVIATAVIIATGVLLFNVSIVWHAFGYFAAATFLGIACFFLIGAAVTTVVPKSETTLPIAFGTMLPLAFISNVFFSVSNPPAWLHYLSSAFPVAPIARAMEDSFDPATQSWPMPVSGLLVVLGWSAAAIVVIALTFRWEPGPAPAARGLGRSPRWLARRRHEPASHLP
jgi:ABC-2 type transport system permease protein